MDEKVSSSKSWIDNKVYSNIMIDRTLMSCKDCVFCMEFYDGWENHSYICNLGLDEVFHKRNETLDDGTFSQIGCKRIDKHPTIPCKARYTDEEMRKLLGV